MAHPDGRLLEEFRMAEETLELFGALGWPIEPWVALRLVRTEGEHLRREVARLGKLRREGRSPFLGMILSDAVARIRQTLSRRIGDLRRVLEETRVPLDPLDFEWILGMLLRDGADQPSEEAIEAKVVERARYLRALEDVAVVPAPPPAEVPAGVDGGLLDDLRLAEQFLDGLETGPKKVDVWEAFTLAVEHREALKAAALRLRRVGPPDDLNSEVIRLLEKLIDVRSRFAVLARRLREFVVGLPIGSYNRELMELAFAFILVSPEGRSRVDQWLESPDHFRREAAIRVEGVIGRAQKYQHALRAHPAA
jgi:hypothetical protein